jgi:hypothetical protein
MANLGDKKEVTETAEEKARRLDEEEALGNHAERPKDNETAKEKADRLDFEEAEKLVEENGKGDLSEFIEDYDDLDVALKKIEDPDKREEVKKENEFMRKQAEEYWNSLHDDMKKAENGDESPDREEEKTDKNQEEEAAEAPEKRELNEEEAAEGAEYVENLSETIDNILEEEQPEEDKIFRKEYKEAEDKGKFIEGSRKSYADKLGLKDYKGDEEEKKRFEKMHEDITQHMIDPERAKGLMDKEADFAKILEEGSSIIKEGNPEKVKAYFEEMAIRMDDAADYLRTVYLQMEADPEMREMLEEQYVSIVSSIKKFEAAAAKLRKMIEVTETAAREGRELTEAEKREMVGLIDYLKAIAFALAITGEALVAFAKYSKAWAIAHPTLAKTIGWPVGLKIGSYIYVPSALASAKFAGVIAGLILAFNEEKRDALVEKITGVKLPSWAKPKSKGGEAKK